MSAGTFRSRITIQDRAGTISATGGITETTPTTVAANVPASIEPVPIAFQSRETAGGGGLRAVTTHVITLWYRTDLKPRMWILHGTREFQIVTMINVGERNREMQLLCNEWGS